MAVRQVAPEREVFEAAKRGVFRVEAGLGHGSGFLAPIPGVPKGLVVTDDHVVADDTVATIYLDSVTRVSAVVVSRDREADLALLRIPDARCTDCPRLTLASPKDAKSSSPSAALLPAAPLTTYPLIPLKAVADQVDPKSYRKLFERDADHFTLTITTPVVYRVQQRLFESQVGEERKKREATAGVSKDQAYSETRQSRDWEQYVGDASTPVVTIAVSPKVGETSGSAIARALSGANGNYMQASLVFQGDVRGVRF